MPGPRHHRAASYMSATNSKGIFQRNRINAAAYSRPWRAFLKTFTDRRTLPLGLVALCSGRFRVWIYTRGKNFLISVSRCGIHNVIWANGGNSRRSATCLGIAFASIGLGHGVLVLFWKISGLLSEPWLKHNGETGEEFEKASGQRLFEIENLQRAQSS